MATLAMHHVGARPYWPARQCTMLVHDAGARWRDGGSASICQYAEQLAACYITPSNDIGHNAAALYRIVILGFWSIRAPVFKPLLRIELTHGSN